MSADTELYGIIREIELVEEDIRDRNRAKSDIYKEAGAKGYDKKTIRKVVAARRLDPLERDEQDNVFDAYMQAVERAEKGSAHARVENIEQFPPHDPETGELTDTQEQPETASRPAHPRHEDHRGAETAEAEASASHSQVGENVSASTAARNDAGKRGVTAGETATNPVLMQEPRVEADRDGGAVHEHGREEGSHPRLPSDPVENKTDGPSVIAAAPLSPSVAPPADTVALEPQAPRPDATVFSSNPQPSSSLGNADEAEADSSPASAAPQQSATKLNHSGYGSDPLLPNAPREAVTDQAGVAVPQPVDAPAATFINPQCRHPDTCAQVHSEEACFDCFLAWAKLPKDEQIRLWQEAMEAASETEAAA